MFEEFILTRNVIFVLIHLKGRKIQVDVFEEFILKKKCDIGTNLF